MSEEHQTKKERKAQKKQEQQEHRDQEAQARREASTKLWTIIIISAVVIIGFLVWLIQNAPEVERPVDQTPGVINPVSETDNVKGAVGEAAKITLIEYSDFECPACGTFYPLIKEVVAGRDDVQFVYRHLPIRPIHPNAELAARYAEAAGLQGKFFEMHDKIFEGQLDWTNASVRPFFDRYAEELGLDIDKLKEDIKSEAVIQKIEKQRLDGVSSGANSTPTFFIETTMIPSGNNPQSVEQFNALLDQAIAQIGGSSIDTSAIFNALEETTVTEEPESTDSMQPHSN